MTEHPDDVQFLDEQPWTVDEMWPSCGSCAARAATITVDLIERASGPAYEVRYCRSCVAELLRRTRARAESRGEPFTPALPERVRL